MPLKAFMTLRLSVERTKLGPFLAAHMVLQGWFLLRGWARRGNIQHVAHHFTRAQFLTGMLAAAGSAALAGCTVPVREARPGAASQTPTSSASSTAPGTTAPPPPPSADHYAGRVPHTFDLHMDGITDTVPTEPGITTIALTFDACGGPSGSGLDQELVDTLREFRVPATLFLNSRWIDAHPHETQALIDDPLFLIHNHGTRHTPLSVTGRAAYGIAGTEDPAAAIAEIEDNRNLLRSYGVESDWFRSGTAHYDDVAVEIARDRGVKIAGFTVNADYGATAPANQVAAAIMDAPDGAIVLAHMNQPSSGTAAGVRAALEQMRGGTHRFVFIDGTAPDDL